MDLPIYRKEPKQMKKDGRFSFDMIYEYKLKLVQPIRGMCMIIDCINNPWMISYSVMISNLY